MSNSPVSGAGKWMALTAALLGWMFDGMEMGLFPLVARPALKELLNKSELERVERSHAAALKSDPNARAPEATLTTDTEVTRWYGIVTAGFLIGAAAGGVLFGWLGDRLGRVRAMTLSVLTYTLITGLCAFATEAWHILVLRFLAALGMGGEWSLGVALINEIWPGRSRAFLAGLIGAAANVGFFLSGATSKVLHSIDAGTLLQGMGLGDELRMRLMSHGSWRLMMLVGAAPALICFFFRLFVPESQRWEQERQRGATSFWATRDLLGVLIGAAGACAIIFLWSPIEMHLAWRIVGTVLGFAVALGGFLFPVMRYLVRAGNDCGAAGSAGNLLWPTMRSMLIGAALSGVALIVTWGTVQPAPIYAAEMVDRSNKPETAAMMLGMVHGDDGPLLASAALLEREARMNQATTAARETTQMLSAIGAILFSILAAFFSDMVGRRLSFMLLCAMSLASVLYCYQGNHGYGASFWIAVFLMGGLCSTFYGWLPLYLPELFPTKVRATGQGFCYNFGRILAAIVSLQIGALSKALGSTAGACTVIGMMYLVGMAIIWLAPETRGRPLPD